MHGGTIRAAANTLAAECKAVTGTAVFGCKLSLEEEDETHTERSGKLILGPATVNKACIRRPAQVGRN